MKCGLYKLVFADDVEYIGKSTDIEKRWEEHRTSLLRNKASAKMMDAFHTYGMPSAEVILECHKDHIDILEAFFIDKFAPVLNTNYPESISQEEFSILARNGELLMLSTVQHLDMIERLASDCTEHENNIEELELKLEDLEMDRTMEEVQSAIYSRLQREKDEIIEYYEDKLAAYKAEVEAKKPWWKFW